MKLLRGRLSAGAARTVLLMALCFTGAGFIGGYLTSDQTAGQPLPDRSRAVTASKGGLPDFVDLAKKLEPSVVHIAVTQKVQASELSSPPGDFLERFFGVPIPHGQLERQSLGSGFIIDRKGHILTNNHVLQNVATLTVKLYDDREYPAKVIGRDPKTDVAVIQIRASRDLQPAPLGNSNALQVGEWVAAMGSPFGLDRTLTVGIVSAKGRHIGPEPSDNFIQTDASVNPGNSGGPLIDLQGKVVGVNTAILSRSGGNVGIGFAIPINLVKGILSELKGKGKARPGWLGLSVQAIDPRTAHALHLEEKRGALVISVPRDGPADQAGIKKGDVIVEYNHKKIDNIGDLPVLVANTPIGEKVDIRILREGRERSLSVTVGESKQGEEEIVTSRSDKKDLGLRVRAVTPEIARKVGLRRPKGVIVAAVQPGGAADAAGLRSGDIILEFDRAPINDAADFKRRIAGTGTKALFLIRRGENNLFVALNSGRP